jgi:hypothetical protein
VRWPTSAVAYQCGGLPVRWSIGEEPLVIGVRPLAPATIGVVTGLLGDDRLVVVGEVDFTIAVGAGLLRFETGHRKTVAEYAIRARLVASERDAVARAEPL